MVAIDTIFKELHEDTFFRQMEMLVSLFFIADITLMCRERFFTSLIRDCGDLKEALEN